MTNTGADSFYIHQILIDISWNKIYIRFFKSNENKWYPWRYIVDEKTLDNIVSDVVEYVNKYTDVQIGGAYESLKQLMNEQLEQLYNYTVTRIDELEQQMNELYENLNTRISELEEKLYQLNQS